MTTFYDDRLVQVTSEAIRVHGRAYPLSALTRVRWLRGSHRWTSWAMRLWLATGAAVPLLVAVAGAWTGVRADLPPPATVALAGFALLVGLATAPLADLLLDRLERSYAEGTRDLQLWADFHGRPVLLLHTRDALRFGRVARALQRALEAPKRRSP